MINVTFWNLKSNGSIKLLTSLCKVYDVDILLLAESNINQIEFLGNLNSISEKVFRFHSSLTNKLEFYTHFPPDYFFDIYDSTFFSVKKIEIPSRCNINFAGVHLPSKMFYNENDQMSLCYMVRNEIELFEKQSKTDNTIIVGDFNMNPFDKGMVDLNGLHSLMDIDTIKRYGGQRKVQGHEKSMFYNPMWGLMGDVITKPSGTYFFKNSVPLNYFWNTFDQVIMRPSLATKFENQSLKIITEIAGTNLLTNAGIPNDHEFSDHLPVGFSFNI